MQVVKFLLPQKAGGEPPVLPGVPGVHGDDPRGAGALLQERSPDLQCLRAENLPLPHLQGSYVLGQWAEMRQSLCQPADRLAPAPLYQQGCWVSS